MIETLADKVRQMSMIHLRSIPTVTENDVREIVTSVGGMLARMSNDASGVDLEAIIYEIESMRAVWAPDSTELTSSEGHVPWLDDKRASIQWDFWQRYEQYLDEEKRLPIQVLSRLDAVTDKILSNIENPLRPGAWSRSGMVVGQVQSGKTANYTGLICKAVDAGYKLVIVLAGVHNSLRSQTQLRLDEGFVGIDSKQSRSLSSDTSAFGVGKIIMNDRRMAVYSPTSSADNGDFNARVAQQFTTKIGHDPVILVVKKNGSVLNNLFRWVQANLAQPNASGSKSVRNLPMIMLDDEADNASVNTKEEDPTAINKHIRKILKSFEQSAYVGYTATPFANIFINPEATTPELGDDLFPSSFIINLHSPSNYIGPVEVFGLSTILDADGEEREALPIVRVVTDADDFVKASQRKTSVITEMPQSLRTALMAFLLACAARHARGQESRHNSMLVHVTRFNAVQQNVADLIAQEIKEMKQRLLYGDGSRATKIRDDLQQLWEEDFEPTSNAMAEAAIERINVLSWSQVEAVLNESVRKIHVKLVNGLAGDVLDYADSPNGVSVIAVGGDKLSRGLTLEGLSVSYYLRASRMYDTLMQMGRWFGYRPGYSDLCRLYTTPELIDWYKHITVASEELRQEFDYMAQARLTPLEYGLKVQTHPGGLTVTSAGKMRGGHVVRVSFARQLIESYRLKKDSDTIAQNFRALEQFIGSLGSLPAQERGGKYWRSVSGTSVVALFDQLVGHPSTPASDPKHLAEYISKKMSHGELTEWTVVLIDRGQDNVRKVNIDGAGDVRLTVRAPEPPQPESSSNDPSTYTVNRRHVISMDDEAFDLSKEQWKAALEATKSAWKSSSGKPCPTKPSGFYIRSERPLSNGLLLLYLLDPSNDNVFAKGDLRREGLPFVAYAVSFPSTADAYEAVEYMVNTVYLREEEEYADELS